MPSAHLQKVEPESRRHHAGWRRENRMESLVHKLTSGLISSASKLQGVKGFTHARSFSWWVVVDGNMGSINSVSFLFSSQHCRKLSTSIIKKNWNIKWWNFHQVARWDNRRKMFQFPLRVHKVQTSLITVDRVWVPHHLWVPIPLNLHSMTKYHL